MCKYCDNWKIQKSDVFSKVKCWKLNITSYNSGITPEMWIGNSFEQVFCSFPINYCPFCGKELK